MALISGVGHSREGVRECSHHLCGLEQLLGLQEVQAGKKLGRREKVGQV